MRYEFNDYTRFVDIAIFSPKTGNRSSDCRFFLCNGNLNRTADGGGKKQSDGLFFSPQVSSVSRTGILLMHPHRQDFLYKSYQVLSGVIIIFFPSEQTEYNTSLYKTVFLFYNLFMRESIFRNRISFSYRRNNMKYCFDNDLHIHSQLSRCSRDPEQTTDAILRYAIDNGLKTVCIADHYWDENVPGPSDWYAVQNYEHIAQSLPLPQAGGVRFLFGCETELRADMTLGISPAVYDRFDFIIIPTTHLHMNGFTCRGDENAEERAKLWVSRFDGVLDMDLPFHKVGIAHPTCHLIYPDHSAEVLGLLTENDYAPLFHKAAEKGVGIELNFSASSLTDENRDCTLLPYRIAKAEGCKFYFGSDAHHPEKFAVEKQNAEAIIELLGLEENDKFHLI